VAIVKNKTSNKQIIKLFPNDFISFKNNLNQNREHGIVINGSRHAKLDEKFVVAFRKSSLGVKAFMELFNHDDELLARILELKTRINYFEEKFNSIKSFVDAEQYLIKNSSFKGKSL